MASSATEVEAGGRTVRVSSPDRVIFPETETSAAVTKLQVVEYYLAVGPGILRALRALEDSAPTRTGLRDIAPADTYDG